MMISSHFESFDVQYCPRDCNRVTYAIAKLVTWSPQEADLLWDGTAPGVEELVAGDSAASAV